MRRLLPLLFLLAGCPSLGQRMDPAAWEQELDLLTLDLQDAQDVAQDAQLKAALARASEVTSRVSDALERYQTLGGDNLELLLTIETALSELDQILASDPDNGDLRAGILLVKVALRRMAAYVKE